jgi:hypothetical protein
VRAALCLGLMVALSVALLASSAVASRPATATERSAMVAAMEKAAADAALNDAPCYGKFRVSTVNPRYGAALATKCTEWGNFLFLRHASQWSVVRPSSPYCYESNPPRRVMDDLLGPKHCGRVQYSDRFVTPSNNIACIYRGDRQSVGEVWCYVRSSHTLAVVNESGAGRNAYVKRGVASPRDLRRLYGPVLPYGAAWNSQFGGVVKCVSRKSALTCVNTNGNDTGFVASRESTHTLA